MRRLICFFFLILLLTGCTPKADPPEINPSVPETTAPAEPANAWFQEIGTTWDAEGKLLEIPLSVPGAMAYTSFGQIDGDLLLYGFDNHIEGITQIELCIVDLDTGLVLAQKDITCNEYTTLQVIHDCIFLVSPQTGNLIQLDRQLNVLNSWILNSFDGEWYMGSGNQLYMYQWGGSLQIRDLNTGHTRTLLEGMEITECWREEDACRISYWDPEAMKYSCAVLDLLTGDVSGPDTAVSLDSVQRGKDFWLYSEYRNGYRWFYHPDGGELLRLPTTHQMLNLTQDERLLVTSGESGFLQLYQPDGTPLGYCQLYYDPCQSYSVLECIPSKTMGGYFLIVEQYYGDTRLLYWDISKGEPGDALGWEPIPEPSEQMKLLDAKAQELEDAYGLIIDLGEECDTVFDGFTASVITDYDTIYDALDILSQALSRYPQDFFRQICQGQEYNIRIQLIADLWADGYGRYGDGYIAFAQDQWDHYLIVADIQDCWEDTYHHEFSHIIDDYLLRDSWNREDALFSEDGWNSYNPDWFDGYSYDYSMEHELYDYDHFVNSYSTVSPTEDRAVIFACAMDPYDDDTFSDVNALYFKLSYYCDCIRDAFDTTNWPEVLTWEQHLSVG